MRRTGLVFHERLLWHDPGSAASVIPPGGFVEPGPHSESPERVRRFAASSRSAVSASSSCRLRPRPAERDELLRFHTPAYLDRVAGLSEAGHGDAGFCSPVGPSTYEIAVLAAGALPDGGRRRCRGRAGQRVCARAPARPPRARRARHGRLLLRQHRARGHARAGGARHRARRRGRLGRPSRQRHAGSVLGRPLGVHDLAPPGRLLSARFGCGRTSSAARARAGPNINLPLPPGSGVGAFAAASSRSCSPRSTASSPASC